MLVKFLLTLLTTIVLLQQLDAIGYVARVAAAVSLEGGDFRWLRRSLAGHATDGLLILIVTTTLSIYKPQGLTRYEARIEAK